MEQLQIDAAGFEVDSTARVALAEFVDPSGGIHDFLLAGKERVAGGTDFHVQLLTQGGTGREFVAATADHFDFGVFRMNIRFHDRLCKKLVNRLPPKRQRVEHGN